MAETEQSVGDFEGWLTALFSELGLDGDVYGGYISGALENLGGAAPLSEVEESLAEILDSLVEDEDERTSLTKRVVSRWQREQESKRDAEEPSVSQEVDESTQNAPSPPPPSLPAPSTCGGVASGSALETTGLSNVEKKRLIAQYGCESDEEDDEDPGAKRGDLFQNMNAEMVTAMVKAQKEQQKIAHVAKVERDKKSRENQKQKQEDRKEKEKKRTQKHERRR